MLKESTKGEIVWELMLEGSDVVSRVLRRSEWVREGIEKDWRMLVEDERNRIEKGIRRMCNMWFLDEASMDLMDYQPGGFQLPPSPYFIQICTASLCHELIIFLLFFYLFLFFSFSFGIYLTSCPNGTLNPAYSRP